MVVVYCATRNLYPVLPTALNSLIQNNSSIQTIYLIIEDDYISYITHPKVKFINCNKFDFINKSSLNTSNKFTYMALVRCMLSKILDEPKVLYLDVDTIVDGSIFELWTTPLGLNLIAAYLESPNYYNSGVLLMNLRDIAYFHYDDKLLDLLQSETFNLPDQDAINHIFKGKITDLPMKFNAVGMSSKVCHGCKFVIRHPAGMVKPWQPNAAPEDIKLWNKYKVDSI